MVFLVGLFTTVALPLSLHFGWRSSTRFLSSWRLPPLTIRRLMVRPRGPIRLWKPTCDTLLAIDRMNGRIGYPWLSFALITSHPRPQRFPLFLLGRASTPGLIVLLLLQRFLGLMTLLPCLRPLKFSLLMLFVMLNRSKQGCMMLMLATRSPILRVLWFGSLRRTYPVLALCRSWTIGV